MARKILEGVRVVDFTRVVAGPYCTRMLADMGAAVVKVDAPFTAGGKPVRANGSVQNNLGKRSIALDLKHPDGVEVARRLMASADVVVENFAPGVMARLGLGYSEVSSTNPRLIYTSISGFGQSGSFSHRRAFGATAHAEAGWLWVQQQAQRAPEPFAPGVTVADLVTGATAFSGILAALYDRERTGRGQWIDTTLMDAQLHTLSEVAGPALNGAPIEAWQPFRHPVHRTQDGRHLTINIGEAHNWRRIAGALGHEGTPMPASPAQSNELVGTWVAAFDAAGAARRLEAAGAPYGLTMTMHEAAAHPYFAERGMITEVDDPLDGRVRAVDSSLFFSDAESTAAGPAPLAGQHTRAILAECGYASDTVAALLGSGAAQEQGLPA
ncbi:MAG: CoA transferase [Dehalococcoidia bacterium]|nr:MAG: CoA transferase [Dehalococcoidia bacterium]